MHEELIWPLQRKIVRRETALPLIALPVLRVVRSILSTCKIQFAKVMCMFIKDANSKKQSLHCYEDDGRRKARRDTT